SRRRHTRFKCDWSSDVCSSDLARVHLLVLVLRLEVELAVRDGEDRLDAGQRRAAQERLVQQALAVGEADERLRMQLARDGPEPRSEERRVGKEGRTGEGGGAGS